MAKRFKLRRGKSRRMFSKTARRTNWKNVAPSRSSAPMRGGIRL